MPVCIAGMHRSGTSLVAHLLHDCGLYLGPEEHLIPATKSNTDGHWEHAGFVAANDEILSAMGGGWDCPPAKIDPWTSPKLQGVREKADCLAAEFAGHEPWGWKDPRNSLTFPLWKSIFPEARFVVCLRNPLEVVMSLRERGMSSYSFALNLWKLYYRAIIETTEADARCFVWYRDCLAEPAKVLDKILGFCDMPIDESRLASACAVVKPSLRHQSFTDDDLMKYDVADDIVALYRQLGEEAVATQPSDSSTKIIANHSGRTSMPTSSASGNANASRKSHERKKAAAGTLIASADGQPALDVAALDAETLRRQVTALRAALERKDEAAQLSRKELGEAQACVAALGAKCDALTSELTHRDSTIAEFEETKRQLQSTVNESLAISRTLHSNMSETLHEQFSELKRALSRSEESSRASQLDARHELHDELCEMKLAVSESLAALQALQTATSQVLRDELGVELHDLKQRLIASQEAANARDAMLAELRSEVSDLNCALTDAQEERATLQLSLVAQSRELSELREVFEQSHGRLIDEMQVRQAVLERALHKRDRRLQASAAALKQTLLNREDDFHKLVYELHSAQAISQLQGEAARGRIEYERLLSEIRAVVSKELPRDAFIAVVSKGDNALLRFFGRTACDYPQNASGVYSGFHPADSIAAIAQLEWLRARGVTHFLLPAPSTWYLEAYGDLNKHLQSRYRCVSDKADVCVIYSLIEPAQNGVEAAQARFGELLLEFRYHFHREPCVLDWGSGLDVALRYPSLKVLEPQEPGWELPYMDHSIDVVIVPAQAPEMVSEAGRVAESALLIVGDDESLAKDAIATHWRAKAFPGPRDRTSIIIPVHNQIANTEICLSTLLETIPSSFDVEIIVVDDASTDSTPKRLAERTAADPRIVVLRNETNLGFLGSVNRAAASSTGDILLFLNNDTVLLPGWFAPLLQTFRDFPDAGVVGGRLLFPDGRLQEAGGMVFCDGSAGHFGRDDYNLAADVYNSVREVDYCSGALLATRHHLFNQLGGFDSVYGFGYYEDTDYCFQVRRKGHRVYYQPKSTIIHIEGATAGTDLAAGAKRYQVINQTHFVERWKDEIARLPRRPDHGDSAGWKAAAFHRAAKEANRK